MLSRLLPCRNTNLMQASVRAKGSLGTRRVANIYTRGSCLLRGERARALRRGAPIITMKSASIIIGKKNKEHFWMTFLSVPRGQSHSNSKPIMPSIVGTPRRRRRCFSWRRQEAARGALVQRDNPRYTKACMLMPCAGSLSMCAQRQHPSAQMNHRWCPPTMQFFCLLA